MTILKAYNVVLNRKTDDKSVKTYEPQGIGLNEELTLEWLKSNFSSLENGDAVTITAVRIKGLDI